MHKRSKMSHAVVAESDGCSARHDASPVAKILLRTLSLTKVLHASDGVRGRAGASWRTAHSLSLRSSLFPRFSSEPARDRELMKGEVEGSESAGPSGVSE